MQTPISLVDGIKVGETLHKELTIKSLTIGETLDAYVRAEKAIVTPDGWKLATNSVEVEFYRVLAAVSLTNDPGVTLTKDVLRGLSERDYNAIIDGMMTMEILNIEAAEERGRV